MNPHPICRRLIAGAASVLLFAGSIRSAFAVNPIDFFPLGGLGGRANYTDGSNLLNATEVYAGGPAANAGLLVGDFIYAVNGKPLSVVSANRDNGWRGGVSELGYAIERAESTTGALSLGVMRPGVGAVTLNATLALNTAWRPSYPSGDPRADALFEKTCADLHTSILASSGVDYSSGWYGMSLLASPNWNDTSGAKPYRNSINRLRDLAISYLNGCILEPVEPGAPGYVSVGLENWAIATNCMFIGEYRRKTGDTSVDASVQRCALLLANRIQCYDQSDDAGVFYNWKHGIMGHGGVTGDYAHLWLTGINIINAHTTVAMGILKGAGADFSALAGSSGLTIDQKFLTNWAWLKACTRADTSDDDGCVGYQGVESGWDAAGRTAGAAAGYQIYLNAGGTAATADDLDKLARQKAYVARQWARQQHCHAYSAGSVALSQAVLPFMADRSQRYFMENSRFLYTLSRDQTGGVQYFPGRLNNTGDGYLGTGGVKYYMGGLFQAMGTGNLPSFPAPSATRAFVRMNSPLNDWPQLAARRAKVIGLVQPLNLDVTNHLGNVLTSGYSAAWSQVSGATVSFSSTTTEDTSVTFPAAGNYRLRLIATVGSYVVTEDYDFEVSTAAVPPVTNVIVGQPVSRTTSPGGTAVFSVSTSGDGPFLYEWRLNGVAYWGASPNSQLSLSNVSSGMAGTYQCTIYTPTGSLLSNSATLTLTSTSTVTAGGLRREVWNGLSGSAVSDLTSRLTYPNLPDVTETVTSAETPQTYGDSYGQRLSGWIIPPTTGQYKFYIAADDGSELWLSTTNSAANKVKIAFKTSYSGYRSYSTGGQSALISLTAGQHYYIEILHKEGSGGDNLSVAWQTPGAAVPADGSAPIDGAYLESMVDVASPEYVGMASFWKMDSGSGSAAIDDFGSNDGAISGATWVAGKRLGALGFDGNDSVTCGAKGALSGTTAFTAAAWVKVNSGNNLEGVIVQQRAANGYNGQYQLKVSSTGKPTFYAYGGGAQQFNFSGATSINDGLWHHVAGVRDASGAAFIYLDGVLNGSVTGTTVCALDANINIGIGADIRDSINYFRGSIDELRIYSRALTQTELADQVAEISNTPPAFASDPMTGAGATEDVTYSASLAGSATDANAGDLLTFSKISGPAWLVVAANGALSGTPGNDDNGAAGFTIRVTDRFGLWDEALLNITVTAVNDAPLFSADPISKANATHDIAYSQTLAGSATDVDAGDLLTFSKISGPAWLSVASNGGLTGTPTGVDVGTNSFVVRVTDTGGLSDDATLNVSVVLANPAADSDSDGFTDGLEVALGTNFQSAGSQPNSIYAGLRAWWRLDETSGTLADDTTGRLQDGTVNGGAAWSAGNDGGALAFDGVNDGVLVGTSAALTGTTDLTLSAWVKVAPGSSGGVILQQRDATSTGFNGEYVLSVKSSGVVEFFIYRDGFQFDITTTAVVNNGQWHRITATRSGTAGAIYIDGTQVATGSGAVKSLVSLGVAIGYDYRDNLNYFKGSIDDVRIYSRALSALEIGRLADYISPVFIADPMTGSGATEDSVYTATLAGSASDASVSDTLLFSKVSGPAWLSIAPNGALSGTPANSDVGANSFAVRVTDSTGLADDAMLNIAVSNVNDAPVFAANPINLNGTEDSAFTGQLAASDVDAGDTLTYGKVSGPAWLMVSSTGALSGTPTNSEVGANAFTVRVTDGSSATADATLNITVVNVNDAPVFSANPLDGGTVPAIAAYTGNLASFASDVDSVYGDTLSFSKTSGPAWLIVAANGALSGTPGSGDQGVNSFGVRVTDAAGLFAETALNFSVIVDGVWIQNANGSWPTVSNWSGGASPNGIGGTASFATLNITADRTVTLDSAVTLSGMTFGDTTASHNWILNAGTGGSLALNITTGTPTINVNNQTTTINVPISGTKGMLKSGAGTLTLAALNTFTGNVTVNGGILRDTITVNNTNPTATGLGNMTTVGRTVTVNSGGTLTFNASDAIGQYNYKTPVMLIADGGTITRVSGTTTFNSIGDVSLRNGGRLTTTNGNTSTVGSFGINGNVTVSGTSGSFIDTLAGQTTNSYINLGTTAGSTTFDVAATGDPAADLTVSAVLGDKTLGGAAGFTKTGAGKIVLTAANTFTGTTTVSAGTLFANNTTGSGTGSGAINVAATATLGGSGTVGGALTVNGTLAPGNGIGTFTTGALTLTPASGIAFQLNNWNGAAGTGYDKVVATSINLTATQAQPVQVVITPASLVNFTNATKSFTLATASGGITGFAANKFSIDATAIPAATGTWSVQQSGNNLLLVHTEPNFTPVFTADPFSRAAATEDAAYTGTIAGAATDGNAGDVLTYTKISGPAWLNVSSSGALSGTPANGDVGSNVFVVRVTDSTSLSAQATLTISVTNTNDTPVFTVTPINAGNSPASSAFVGSIAGSATDPDLGDTLTYSKTSGPAWLSIASSGVLSGTPGVSDSGANNFTVRVTDGGGLFAQTTLTITVTSTPLQTWQSAQFAANASNPAIAADLADPDGDGLKNLLEYALGTNPNTTNTSGILSDMETISGTAYLRLTVNKNVAATDVIFTVETCGDLGDWSSANTVIETNTAGQLIVRDSLPGARRFIRLKVTH